MRTLNEILDKYNVSEKNGSSGNLKALKKTIEELEKLFIHVREMYQEPRVILVDLKKPC